MKQFIFPDKEDLYQKHAFVVKFNNKAELNYDDGQDLTFQLSLQHMRRYRGCIDIGARFSQWSRPLGKIFEYVYAFELRQKWRTLFEINTKMENVSLYPYGLGSQSETVEMVGNRIVDLETLEKRKLEKADSRRLTETIEVKRLDSFKLKRIDFVKIDTDGYELKVLQGGERTLTKWKPVICMEILKGEPYYGELAEDFLISLGAHRIAVDQIEQNVIFDW